MLAPRSPRQAYRRTEVDARIAASGPGELVLICLEQCDAALGSAITGAQRGDNGLKSDGLTRALSALTALELGVDDARPLAPALRQLYRAARRAVLDSVVRFDASRLGAVRLDLDEVAKAMRSALRA